MRSTWWVGVALALLCLVPLSTGTMLISAPYGDSHDGRNGSTWAAGAESVRDDPIGSRLGAIRVDGTTYANHPPAITVLLGVAEGLAGDRPMSDRAVIVLAMWSSIVLLYLLLRSVELRSLTALAGCAAVAVAPLTRVYGSMVDTPMLALPFAVSVMLAAAQIRASSEVRTWHLVVLFLGPLVSWQLALLEALVLVDIAARRNRRRELRIAGAAVASGVTVLGLWLLWAHGSLGPTLDQLVFRAGLDPDAELGAAAAVDLQWFALRTFLGPLLWMLPFAVAACWSARPARRQVARLSVSVVVLYDLAMANGAAIHDYWSYWVLIPVAIGAASAAEGLAQLLARTTFAESVKRTTAGGLVAIVLVAALARTTTHERVHVSSARVADVLASVRVPEGQATLWALAEFTTGDRWLTDLSPPPVVHLSEQQLRAELGAGNDHHLVVISTSCTKQFLACDRIPGPVVPYADREFRVLRLDQLTTPRARS